MITPEEIVDLAEYLKQKEIPSSSYQLFAAQQVLSQWGQEAVGPASFIQLSNALGPIFCRTAEEQQQFQNLYLEWLRQRSHRPRERRVSVEPDPTPQPETPSIHWRIKLAALSLLLVALLAGWFDYQDFRTRQVVGQVLADGKAVPHATVHVGKGFSDESEPEPSKTDKEGRFRVPFQAKDMPLEITVKAETYLTAKIPVGEAIKANRNWFYLNPITLEDTLDIGSIQLTKEPKAPPPIPTPKPDLTPEPPPSELSIQKIAELSVPPPSWTARLEGWKALGALLPLVLSLLWLAYRKLRAPALKRQASRIPPKLKQVQIQTETHHLFPSVSLRHLTQRLRHTRFVESTELDVAKTIHCTIQRGGLFTPVYGGRQEPGYVALIDRTTLADHQAHLAAQLVKDLAKGYVLVRQYEFDEHPTMLKRVDPLRPVRDPASENQAGVSSLEVMPLEDLHAKFPTRRLLCFGDPRLCFDPMTGKLRPWVETLEGWDERFWLSSNTDRLWGQPERILSRRGFHVVPLSHLGLRFFSGMLEQQEARRSFDPTSKPKVGGSHERLPERWLERHPPSPERLRILLTDLEAEFEEDHAGRSEERGRQGMRWLAACAAYPEIHWALTLEWGVRVFGHGPTTETLLPKLTRLVWFRHAFMPDWFRQALYDRLTKEEAERLSRELTDILSAATTESSEGLSLTIATGATKPDTAAHPHKKTRSLREWWTHLRRTLRLRAMGEKAEPGSPLRDYVTLRYLSGKQGKARGLITRAPKALLNVLFHKGQPWLGFRPFVLPVAAMVATGGLWDWFDPMPVPLAVPIQQVGLVHAKSDRPDVVVQREDGSHEVWNQQGQTWQVTQEEDDTAIQERIQQASMGRTEVADPTDQFRLTYHESGQVHLSVKANGREIIQLSVPASPIASLTWPTADDVWLAVVPSDVPELHRITQVQALTEWEKQRREKIRNQEEQKKAAALAAKRAEAKRQAGIAAKKQAEQDAQRAVEAKRRVEAKRQAAIAAKIAKAEQERVAAEQMRQPRQKQSVEEQQVVQGQQVLQQTQQQEITQQIEDLPVQVEEQPANVEEAPSRITGKDGAVMVLVPAGEFTMGAREDDSIARDDERPAHNVFVDAFYIDQFEVTTSRYAKFFVEMKRAEPRYWSDQVLKNHPKKPVVGVTWDDANAYCSWAGKRIPTEAEWEKAARGTEQRLYPWGQEPPNKELANFDNCCDFQDYGALTDVGSFEGGKSPYGAYDMAGNVWEWVADWYDGSLYFNRANTKRDPPRNPLVSEKGDYRVLRGGGWNNEARNLRSSYRNDLTPTNWINYYVGFRCAQGAP